CLLFFAFAVHLERFRHEFDFVVRIDFVDDGLHQFVDFAALGIVRRTDVGRTPFVYQFAHGLERALIRRVVNGYRMASLRLDKPHAGDVRRPVADEYHVLELYGPLLLFEVLIDQLRIAHRFHALVDFVDELRLVGIVHPHGGPVGGALRVVQERARIDVLELTRDVRPLDDFLDAGGVDVMLYVDASSGAVCVDAAEPFPHAPVIGYLAPRLAERLPLERKPLAPSAFNHFRHVGEYRVCILRLGDDIALLPKFRGAFAHGGDEVVLLHVAGRQRTVEIVYQRNRNGFVFH